MILQILFFMMPQADSDKSNKTKQNSHNKTKQTYTPLTPKKNPT